MKETIKKLVPDIILEKYYDYKKQKIISAYKGNNVLCPICNSEFKIFGTFGLEKRENARCHNCGSLERHRLIWKYLNDKVGLFEKNTKIRLLHFAPKKIFYDIFSKMSNIEYVPCDLFPEKYKYNGKVKVEKVDITSIPFEENHFDFILCTHVLEHIPNDRLAMAELFRVMKKGGEGIFQVPIDYNRETTYEDFTITTPEGRQKAFGQSDHVRWYGQDYKKRLENAGFDVNEDDYVKSFSSEELFMFGLRPSMFVYYCRK